LDASGKFLYVGAFEFETYNDSIEIYSVAQNGTVSLSTSWPNGRYQPPAHLRSAGGYLFIGWNDYGGGIRVYGIDPNTGVPTQVAASVAANFPDFRVNDDGSRVYALGYDNPNWWSAFQTYRLDLTAGTLTRITSANLSPTGNYRGMVYVKKQ